VSRVVDGLAQILDGLPSLADDPDAALVVLEDASGGGDSLGSTLEELAMVLDAAETRGLDGRIRVCLDSAHLWGAGYEVSRPEVIDAILADFDRLIGLRRLAMIHLNDSTSALGSRHDRHTHLGDGEIGRAGLAHLLRHPALSHVAYYLETPRMEDGYDAVNVARLADLVEDRPLTPGPA
jgi:deoxyribonuclease-4